MSSVWWEGGAGHIRLSRIGDVGLRDELGQDLLLTVIVIANLDAESETIKFGVTAHSSKCTQ